MCDLDGTCLSEDEANKQAYRLTSNAARDKHGIDLNLLALQAHQLSKNFWLNSAGFSYGQRIGFGSTDGLCGEFTIPDPEINIDKLNMEGPILRYRAWLEALKQFECEDEALAMEMAILFPMTRRQTFSPYQGAATTLEFLASHYGLAIVTNGVNRIQIDKIRACRIDGVVNAAIVSEMVGVGKPNELMFETALNKLNIPREKVVMVGDSLRSDILGAQKAGVGKTVWVANSNVIPSENIQPNFKIYSLVELPSLLASIS